MQVMWGDCKLYLKELPKRSFVSGQNLIPVFVFSGLSLLFGWLGFFNGRLSAVIFCFLFAALASLTIDWLLWRRGGGKETKK